MTRKEKRRAYKRKIVIARKEANVAKMIKKAIENKEPTEVIDRKEINLRAYYKI